MALCSLAGKGLYVPFAGTWWCEFSAVTKSEQGKLTMIRTSQLNKI